MIASFKFMNKLIDFDECNFQNLVIENKQLFRSILTSIDAGYIDEYFSFSENFVPFNFEKNGYFISDVLNVDFSNKKLMTKVLEYFESVVNVEFLSQVSNIKTDLLTLGDNVSAFNDFDFISRQDIDTISLIKFLDFQINKDEMNEMELFLKFIDLAMKYLKVKVFVTKNMSLYFDIKELESIGEMLALKHINFLNIDGFKNDVAVGNLEYHIIDKDLCNIDS